MHSNTLIFHKIVNKIRIRLDYTCIYQYIHIYTSSIVNIHWTCGKKLELSCGTCDTPIQCLINCFYKDCIWFCIEIQRNFYFCVRSVFWKTEVRWREISPIFVHCTFTGNILHSQVTSSIAITAIFTTKAIKIWWLLPAKLQDCHWSISVCKMIKKSDPVHKLECLEQRKKWSPTDP